ncbi:hypothetical protein D3C81_1196000 [compost metagenome]
MDATVGEAVDQVEQAVEGIEEGLDRGQLRADMAVDTHYIQVRQLRGAHVDRLGIGDGDAELVLFEAGGDVRVSTGVHVRVDPQRDRRNLAHLGGNHLQALKLVGGFDVEAVHADFQGAAHVVTGLADAGEHHAISAPARGQDTLQFTAGDDVEACAEARQDVQHAQVGVGLDREADQAGGSFEGIGVAAVLGLDVGARVHVGRGAEAFGDGRQGHAFREQFTVAVVESVHLISLLLGRLLGLGLQLRLLFLGLGRLGFRLVLVRFTVVLAVLAFVRQVQGAFLAAGRDKAGNSDQRREGGNQALHWRNPLKYAVLRPSIPSDRLIAYASPGPPGGAV